MKIYKTTNLINNKIYIGQNTTNDDNYYGSGFLITKAIKKYGIQNFKKEIIEECENKTQLNEREIYWIEFYNSRDNKIGYNISKGGTGGKLVEVEGKKGKTYEEYYGLEKANEIKKKLSISQKNKGSGWKNNNGEKISKALKGRVILEETKEKISKSVKNFFDTEKGIESKNKLSNLRKNKPLSAETKLKQSIAMKGRRPKILEVHPTSKYWSFYDKDNNFILKMIGNRGKTLKELGTNQKRIKIFYDLEECLKHKLEDNMHFKVYGESYY